MKVKAAYPVLTEEEKKKLSADITKKLLKIIGESKGNTDQSCRKE